jgi:tRNA-modifying protein YgfZ
VTAHDLSTRAGVVAVPWAVLRVHGPEAASYLQGQLSQDVTCDVGTTTWTFLLQPTGKVDAWLRLTRLADDDYLLDAPCTDPDPVVARLERFKLRTKADIDVLDRTVWSHRGPGSGDAASALAGVDDLVLPGGWPSVEGADVVTSRPLEPHGPVSLEDWHALRIECGVPLNGADLGPDTIPAEAGDWVLRASASFSKGCYTGQELVARIDSRGGNVPRPIRVILLGDTELPPVGATVEADGRAVGVLSSVAESATHGRLALAPLGRMVEPGAEVDIRWDGRSSRGTVAVPPLR